MPRILIRHHGKPVGEQALEAGLTTIGRLPHHDLRLDNMGISRNHAFLLGDVERRIFVLEDLKSLNGTFVNKKKVHKCLLRPGDVVAMGDYTLELLPETAAESPAPAEGTAPELVELETGKRHRISKDSVYFGNSSMDDIQVPGIMVGKHFASLDRKGTLWIVNLIVKRFSRLLVNGEEVHSAKLRDGDELDVAGTKFIFHLPDPAAA